MAKLKMGVAVAMTALRAVSATKTRPRSLPALDDFCTALSRATGLDIESSLEDDYPSLLSAMRSGQVAFAWLPPVVALRAVNVGRALAIALPMREGLAVFHSALFASADSPLTDELDVFGARAAWVDRESAAGYLVIRAALRARGLGFERAFKEEKFYGSHDAVVRAVLHGEADVGATYVHVLPDDSIGKAGWGAADVKVLARYGPIPADVIAASSSLPGDQVRAVQAALTNPKERTLLTAAKRLLEADGFVEAESTHLRPLDALLRFLDDSPRRWGSMFPPAK